MGDAPAVPDQTPVVFVLAGMSVSWDDACKQALTRCGVNPENFGSYSDRAKDEKAARDRLGSGYKGEKALKDHGAVEWCEANSQSGHVMQNAFLQGKRDDPCSNVRPQGGDGGGYGYDMRRALCMDHFGGSTIAGTPHYEITQGEADFARSLPPGTRVDTNTMEQSVRNTAAIAVAGSQARMSQPDVGELTEERRAQAQKFQAAQQAHAVQLQGPAAPGAVAAASGAQAGAGPAAGESGAVNADQQKAVDCIVAAWKKSLDQVRKDAIEQNSTAAQKQKAELAAHNAKNPPGVASYDQIPPPHKEAADQRVSAAVETRQAELEQKKADSAGEAKKPPTKDDCREYQANWLWQQQQKNGSLPDVAGRKPGESTNRTADLGDSGETEP